MNINSTRLRFIRLSIVGVILALAFLGTMTAIRAIRSPDYLAPTATHVYGSYRPEDHGLPEIIGGYRILGVMTLENTACMPANEKRVVLQVDQTSPESFLGSNFDVAAVRDELNRIDPTVRWGIAIVGPGATAEQIARGNPEWNAAFADGNCPRLGGPILNLTPRP